MTESVKFRQDIHDKYDPAARDALEYSPLLRSFLREQFGVFRFSQNPNKYGIDFRGFDPFGNPVRDIEVETKLDAGFRDGTFDWDDVHVAWRKEPIFVAGHLVVQFDKLYEYAVVIDPRTMPFSKITKWNKRKQADEDFVSTQERDVFIVKVKASVAGDLIRPPLPPEEPQEAPKPVLIPDGDFDWL
tara:strand:- start:336 stop:896 length:561 start_codon:yes stop_codon:yes gene_type:complete